MLLDHLRARAQPQVEGIAEDNLGTGGDDVARQHAFDGAIGADRHERRGLHSATREGQATTTGFAVRSEQFKRHTTHKLSSGPRGAGLRVINIASP